VHICFYKVKNMLESISWGQLGFFLSIVIMIYYAAVVFTYYLPRNKLLALLGFKNQPVKNNSPENYIDDDGDLFALASTLSVQIRQKLAEAAKKNWVREELMVSMELLLRPFSRLKTTAFQTPITDLIANGCKSQCSITLSEDELNMLWNG
jgi:hypothetical protein